MNQGTTHDFSDWNILARALFIPAFLLGYVAGKIDCHPRAPSCTSLARETIGQKDKTKIYRTFALATPIIWAALCSLPLQDVDPVSLRNGFILWTFFAFVGDHMGRGKDGRNFQAAYAGYKAGRFLVS